MFETLRRADLSLSSSSCDFIVCTHSVEVEDSTRRELKALPMKFLTEFLRHPVASNPILNLYLYTCVSHLSQPLWSDAMIMHYYGVLYPLHPAETSA